MTHGTARLFLELTVKKKAKLYRIARAPVEPPLVLCWRIYTTETDYYEVAVMDNGRRYCTCPSFEFRSEQCKHLRSLGALGLLPKEKP